MGRRLRIVSLSANKDMADEIANLIGTKVLDSSVTRFADGEILFEAGESFRGDNIYIVQSTCAPVNDRLMEVLVCVDACKRASAKNITCIMPYFGYARQDRKAKPRQPITAKLVADMLEVAGVKQVVACDLHASQLVGFFSIPVDDISPIPLFYKYIKKLKLNLAEDVVCVAPDHGGLVRTSKLANRLGVPIAVIDKRRPKPNQAEVFSIVGDVKDKTCIIVDDIVDTAGTLVAAVNKIHELGAKKVYAFASHGVLSKDAVDKIKNSKLEKLVITDSIPLAEEKKCDKIDVVSLAPLLSRIIVALDEGKSLHDVHQEYIEENN